jgi:hypothetical protein
MSPYQVEMLQAALTAREHEVIEYQVNIDNYTRALDLIGDDAELAPFRTQLAGLLASSRLEQRKAQVMLTVIKQQLVEVGACTVA